MSFTLSEFVVEQALRDQLADLKSDVNIGDAIEDIYGRFLDTVLATKFGRQQIDNLVNYLKAAQISIVSAFPNSSDSVLPQISITMQADVEAEELAMFNDAPEGEEVQIEPAEIVSSFTAISYDPNSGFIYVSDLVDLSIVRYNNYYVDGDGTSHQILTPVSDDIGAKRFPIEKNVENLNLTGGKIVSAVNVRLFLVNTIPSREHLLIGVHTENSTLTKLIYHLVKWMLYKKKMFLEEKGITNLTLQGSDFNQAIQLLPDHIYSRFLTTTFVAYNSFRYEELNVIDSIKSSTVRVDKDKVTRNDDLDETVETTDD